MQQYFSWSKPTNSQKIVITEIFSTKHKPLDSRCKYAPLIYNVLLNYPNELLFTKTELLHILGIVNDNFDSNKFISTANTLKIKYKVLRIITLDIYTLLNGIVMKSLDQLESHGYISIERSKTIKYISSDIKPISPEIIDSIYKEKKELLSCDNYFEVIKKNLINEYKSLCNEAFHDLGISHVTNLYKISILRPLETQSINTSLNSLCRSFLLKHYSNNSTATRVINWYTSSSTERF